ncbi:MAG: crotonase/enoyl-CoA hydratase family protein [Desertimonas sp.]
MNDPSFTETDASAALVLIERHDRVGVLTINRAEARNAISRQVTIEMAAAIDELEADPSIWVLVITGAGERSFCAGADLKTLARGRPTVPELGGFAGITTRTFLKPVIAAVNGFALGGGTEICLSCDLVVAEEHATFGLPEVRRGIVAGAGGLERLPRRVPPAIAMEMILTGEPIDAARALALGLVNRVVPRGGGLDAAKSLADKICQGAPLAVRYSKAVARSSMAVGEIDAVRVHDDLRRAVFASADAQEGPRAFAEKRTPAWTAS